MSTIRQVHQVHPSVSYGDAIGNDMLEIQRLLVNLGYKSEIYAKYIHPKMHDVKDFKEYKKISSPNNILLLHYSIGYDSDLLSFIKSLPDKKILIYHNITPHEYFHGINTEYEHQTRVGRKELKGLMNIVYMGLGVSEYNRQELISAGFRNTGVLPIIIDWDKYKIESDDKVIRTFDDDYVNVLFVGRVSPNKKFEDVIKCFYHYNKYINSKSRLILVGSCEGMEKYHERLMILINELDLDNVYFIGHVSFEELISYFRLADLFLCMSEHEGFCVPLLESMFFEIPIIAYNSTAIPYTLGDSGILVREKRYEEIAEMMNIIIEDEELRSQIVRTQTERLKEFTKDEVENQLKKYLDQAYEKKADKLKIRIEGTFEDSYSLSIVNRNLALSLHELDQNVSLYATTGCGDYIPAEGSINDARTKALWLNTMNDPDFVIRNIYPPRIKDLIGKYNLIYFAWEESQIPKEWANEFNKLDGIMVPSQFVKKVLEDSGIKSRIEVIPNCVNLTLISQNSDPMPIKTEKKFIFLNIGSGFPRKGIDVLLMAFAEEFSIHDDVCLVIKTFPNIHNDIHNMIKRVAGKDSPEIIHIDQDLSEREISALYKGCDCFVSPTRGEGFGLPMAEAMACKIPVIVTGYSGHLDFCSGKNAYLINYKLVPSESHIKAEYQLDSSYWAEPDVQHLKQLMRYMYENKNSSEVEDKIKNAYDNIINNFIWIVSAKKTLDFLNKIDSRVKLGMVSTWNTKCGISEYTKNLMEDLSNGFKVSILANHVNSSELIRQDRPNVIRCWDLKREENNSLDELYEAILDNNLKIIHFQFNFGLFELKSLASLVKKLKPINVNIIITFHSTECTEGVIGKKRIGLKDIKNELKLVDRILVHTPRDVRNLSQIGIDKNVVLIPQGNKVFQDFTKYIQGEKLFVNSKIISTFGFFLPHKGILETIYALPQLRKQYPDMLFLVISSLYPVDSSREYYGKCKQEVNRLGLNKNVVFFTDFLREDEIIELLHASDIVVMPYKETKESSSAAIRFALSSRRPVLTTRIPIFDEFDAEVFKVDECTPDCITQGVNDLYEKKELRENIVENAKRWIEMRSWKNISKEYEDILKNL